MIRKETTVNKIVTAAEETLRIEMLYGRVVDDMCSSHYFGSALEDQRLIVPEARRAGKKAVEELLEQYEVKLVRRGSK
jgi:hypothetical protein